MSSDSAPAQCAKCGGELDYFGSFQNGYCIECECWQEGAVSSAAGCMFCEAPAQPAEGDQLPLCSYHNPGGEPVSAAEHLQACTPAQCDHDQTVGELGGMTASGEPAQCANCGEEVIRW